MFRSAGSWFNRIIDSVVRPSLRLLGKNWPAFQAWGYTGLAVAIGLSTLLVLSRGLSPWIMAGVSLSAMATFLGLAMVSKILTGEERLTYYHHEVAVLAVSAGLLWLLRQPVLPYLDATLLGVGAFLSFGRIGCLMVGCCHGRPHGWGVCYGEKHVAAGFPRYLRGVRLFPIQLVESAWVGVSVLVGSWLVLAGRPPGAALAWYIIAYDLGRFGFEFLRGDAARPYRWGFSEAQWTSLLLMLLVVVLEVTGRLPQQGWHVLATAGLVILMIAIAAWRRRAPVPWHRLLHPRHLRELAQALEILRSEPREYPGAVALQRTSLGIQLSAGRLDGPTAAGVHVTLSSARSPLPAPVARVLAREIARLWGSNDAGELLAGQHDTFHLLLSER